MTIINFRVDETHFILLRKSLSLLYNLYNMEVIVMLIAVSLVLATIFLVAFIWAHKSGQYEDDQSPAVRMLMDDEKTPTTEKKN